MEDCKPPQNPKEDVPEELWASGLGAFATQAISDDSTRHPKTNAAIPSEELVEQAKEWVDYNEK